MSQSEVRHTDLVSSLQMTLRKVYSDTETYPRHEWGSNLVPLATENSVLTTELPFFPYPIHRRKKMISCLNIENFAVPIGGNAHNMKSMQKMTHIVESC